MNSPIGNTYMYKDGDGLITVKNYERDLGGTIWILYSIHDEPDVGGSCPLDVFRDEFVKFEGYMEHKYELNV